ncbi:MAG TPA: NAD(P)/FAD-dependent oxidoreductase [Tepidisphaeraceae bacterium]|jgi:2-polyprenyl-6-methoxyphenol hydroxylase-like FAD-dependent oxidoreductase
MAYSIAIAGCGVAGLTAGLLLSRDGHRVTLFEQSTQLGPVGAGVLLQPSGQMVLAHLGLLERVTQRAERIDRLHAMTHRGRTLINLPYADLAQATCAYGLHRGDLFSVLYAEVQNSGASIVLNQRIAQFNQRSDGIEIINDCSESGGCFDFLIAADGARSALRKVSNIPMHVHDYPHGALWAMGMSQAITNELLQITHGSRQLAGLLPMGEGRCSLFWAVRKGELEDLYAAGFDSWKRDAIQFMPMAKELIGGLRSFEETCFATYLHVRMKRWSNGRLVFLGDAAHAMSPHLGQGINLALLDGLTFAKALRRTGNFTEAFSLYENLRRAHTNYYALVTFLLSPFFQSRGMIKGLGRDIVLPLLPHVPIMRSQMLLTMAGMKRSALGGAIHLP